MQNSSEEKPSEKCRNRFFHDGKKRALQGMFRCVRGGKLFKKTSLSKVFKIYLIFAKRLRASGTHSLWYSPQLSMANTLHIFLSNSMPEPQKAGIWGMILHEGRLHSIKESMRGLRAAAQSGQVRIAI